MLEIARLLFSLLSFSPSSMEEAFCDPGDVGYAVAIEDSLKAEHQVLFVASVYKTLNSTWKQAGHGGFCPFSEPSFAVLLATPNMTDAMCSPMKTRGRVSCSRNGRAVINSKRWIEGGARWELEDYRKYLITHETGHVLGMQHEKCPADPHETTPVMTQQSSSKTPCARNAIPLPKEIERMHKEKRWVFHRIRNRVIDDPWERPPI
jgi:hypothetical protein